jgi:pyruvate/2-oxoglutarate dehydrogenase complex dihydrolipoamide dehydrogenase (E3) component
MKSRPYDLAIIGAGSVGLIAADFARRLGARVALCERDRIGGDCTWTGCVPSKSLLRVAKAAHEMRSVARFGLQPQPPSVDMAQVREYLRSTIAYIYKGTTPDALEDKGIDVVRGLTSFVDPHTLTVGDRRIRSKRVLIATGSEPRIPAMPGLDDVSFFTYREIFENDRLPATMVVIGGGPIGVEIAQAYARLGTRVTIFAKTLLPKEEPETSDIILRVLQAEGVCVMAERAQSVARRGDRISVRSQLNEAECELLLVAVGRRPAVAGLNLEAAGVAHSEHGISVNEALRTSAKNVYAAGDVLGGEQYSHLAGWQGFQAARNALLPGKSPGFSPAMPRVTFSDPEVAQVGKTEAQARSSNANDVVVAQWPIEREDRAVCDDDRDGLLKIITRRNGSILGATMVGHRAGEAIVEFVLAMKHDLRIGQIAATIHPYPTYASGVQLLAGEMEMDRVFSGLSGHMIRAVSKLTRSML